MYNHAAGSIVGSQHGSQQAVSNWKTQASTVAGSSGTGMGKQNRRGDSQMNEVSEFPIFVVVVYIAETFSRNQLLVSVEGVPLAFLTNLSLIHI